MITKYYIIPIPSSTPGMVLEQIVTVQVESQAAITQMNLAIAHIGGRPKNPRD